MSPFHSRYVYAFRYPLDEKAIDRGTTCFLGTHDFTSFCATATEIEDRTRTIYQASWTRSEPEWVFRIRGNGFLQWPQFGQGASGPIHGVPQNFDAVAVPSPA